MSQTVLVGLLLGVAPGCGDDNVLLKTRQSAPVDRVSQMGEVELSSLKPVLLPDRGGSIEVSLKSGNVVTIYHSDNEFCVAEESLEGLGRRLCSKESVPQFIQGGPFVVGLGKQATTQSVLALLNGRHTQPVLADLRGTTLTELDETFVPGLGATLISGSVEVPENGATAKLNVTDQTGNRVQFSSLIEFPPPGDTG